MTHPTALDGILVQWGDRLFYPGNRIVRSPVAALRAGALHDRARAIRARLHATVVRGAPQVMAKVTGGGRGMAAIAAHLRYISKQGRLPIEDDRGVVREGREGVHDLIEQWRHAGARIAEHSPRREAFNLMLSMPAGTPASALQDAARAFARTELSNHRYVMVLHTHQANPHVHLAVRAEGKDARSRRDAAQAWCEIAKALASSTDAGDRKLAQSIVQYARFLPGIRYKSPEKQAQRELPTMERSRAGTRDVNHHTPFQAVQRKAPEIER